MTENVVELRKATKLYAGVPAIPPVQRQDQRESGDQQGMGAEAG